MKHLKGIVLFILVFLSAPGLMGTVMVDNAAAQVRPAMVRSLDEPARVPYYNVVSPTRLYVNQCTATFPAVPTGKRLRVTNISGIMMLQDSVTATSLFVALHNGTDGPDTVLVAFPVAPLNMAYNGKGFSFNHEVNFYFEAGQVPLIELGFSSSGGSFTQSTSNRFIVSGYLVDLLP